jgi:hypothetical protein
MLFVYTCQIVVKLNDALVAKHKVTIISTPTLQRGAAHI